MTIRARIVYVLGLLFYLVAFVPCLVILGPFFEPNVSLGAFYGDLWADLKVKCNANYWSRL